MNKHIKPTHREQADGYQRGGGSGMGIKIKVIS